MLFGYLDAGSGSLLLQAVLGGVAGVVVAAKAWKARLTGRKSATPDDEPETQPVDETTVGTES
jgi:hypothetical protein